MRFKSFFVQKYIAFIISKYVENFLLRYLYSLLKIRRLSCNSHRFCPEKIKTELI
jgi:hypothetical protein